MRFIIIIFLLFPPINAIAQRVAIQGLIGAQLPEAVIFIEDGPVASGNKDVQQGSSDNAVLAFRLRTESGTDRGTALYVTRGGTCVEADVPLNGVKIYLDANSNGEFDMGEVLQGTTSFSGSLASFTSVSLGANTDGVDYIVTYDIAGAATIGCTLIGTLRLVEVFNTSRNTTTPQATLTVIAGAVAFLITDTFTDTDGVELSLHTLDTGESWVEHGSSGSTLRILSNRLQTNATGTGEIYYYVAVDPGTADYSVQATIGNNAGIFLPTGILGRVDTAVRTYYIVRAVVTTFPFPASNWFLQRVVNGTVTSLGSFSGDNPTTADRVALLEMTGTTIRLLIDGVQRISVVDGGITANGRAGIMSTEGGGPETQTIDTFSAFE